MKNVFKKIIVLMTAVAVAAQTGFVPEVCASAADVLMPSNAFSLPMIRGMQFDPAQALNFNFVIDLADENSISEEDAIKLVRYFLAVLTIPENDLWVNLSPDGADRIIPTTFGATEAGEELLRQDLILKKLSASLLNPEQETGRRFWDSVYQKMYDVYGISDIPQEALQRIWIVPEKAVIDEFKNAAYISESRLKVMVEDDYLGNGERGLVDKNNPSTIHQSPTTNIKSTIHQTILPVIEEEINSGENFAPLRQVYHSMILAVWFKTKLKDHIVNRVYSNQSKVEGINMAEEQMASELFDSYLKIFRNGLGRSIQEEYDPHTQQMAARKYVTGGFGLPEFADYAELRLGNRAMLFTRSRTFFLSVAFVVMGAASLFAQDSGRVVKRAGQLTTQDRPVIEQIQNYVTLEDVLSLNGKTNHITGKRYNIDTDYMKRNWPNLWKGSAFGWAKEAIVVTAEEKLAESGYPMTVNGHIDRELRDALAKVSPTSNPPAAAATPDTSAASGSVFSSGSGIGLTINNVPDSLLGGEFKPNFADESYQRSLQATEVSVKTSVLPLNFKFSSNNIGSALTNISLAKDRQLIADYFANANSATSAAGGSPPPSPFSASAWTDFGGKPWAYYGTYNLTYDPKGPFSFWTTTEPTGFWQKGSKPVYTVAQYFGFGYQANPRLFLSLEERLGLQGGVNRLTTASAKFTPKNGKYSLTAMCHLPRMWSDVENRYMHPLAMTFSGSLALANFSLTPSVFWKEGFSDWSLNIAYNFSSSLGVSFEKNFWAAYGFYNYVPNLPLRLNILYTMGNWGFVPYLSSTTYNLFDPQFVYGLALKRTFAFPKRQAAAKTPLNSGESFTSTPPGKGGSNKAMMTDKHGGIDLKMDDAQLETRIHGNFEGLNNLDANLINPETFTGFGVKLIRMVPLFDLSKVFIPADGEPVMISQL